MIGKLRGVVNSFGDDHVILDVAGVGYVVNCSSRTLQHLPRVGDAATLAIETQVREELHPTVRLHAGYRARLVPASADRAGSRREGRAGDFMILPPGDLANAIAMQDKAMVSRAPGVGPKLAARIVAELKDKAPDFASVDPAAARLAGEEISSAPSSVRDAISALCNLGYGRPQALAAVRGQREGAWRPGRHLGVDTPGTKGAGGVRRRASR